MVWGAVAALGGAAISALGSNRAANKAQGAGAAELDFAKQRYQDWQDTFGDLQDNLAQYYGNMTPDYLETQALQVIEQERTRALDRIETDLAQRGIATSGIATQLRQDVELESAQQRAEARITAPRQSAQEQLNFLQVGLGQNPAGTVQDVLSDRATRLNQESSRSNQAAGAAIGSAIDTTFDALADRLNNDSAPAAERVGAAINPPDFRGLA